MEKTHTQWKKHTHTHNVHTHNTPYTHHTLNIQNTHTSTTYKTFIQTSLPVQDAQQWFHPWHWGSSQPPESLPRLQWSTKHHRESNPDKKSILSLRSRTPFSAVSHQPAETLAGVRAGSGPPAQPSWEPGKAVVLLWQRASPSSERKITHKKKRFTFPLGKSFCTISLVAWKSLAGGEGERR